LVVVALLVAFQVRLSSKFELVPDRMSATDTFAVRVAELRSEATWND
jgi:hypothetical protein